jgi:serine/threonine protein kinase
MGCLIEHFELIASNRDLVKLALGIANGMAFLHEKGIIHRDLAARLP